MRKFLLAAASGAGLLAATLAFAQDARPMAPTPVSTSEADKVTCKPVIHEGDIVARRDCHTQKEWDRMAFHNQQALHQWQQQSLTGAVH